MRADQSEIQRQRKEAEQKLTDAVRGFLRENTAELSSLTPSIRSLMNALKDRISLYPHAQTLNLSKFFTPSELAQQRFAGTLYIIIDTLNLCPHIQKIDLSHNSFNSMQMEKITRALFLNHAIICIDLSNCSINSQGAASVGLLMNPSSSSISQFVLNNNPLGDNGMEVFHPLIACNYKLATLHLEGCGIGDQGASFLLAALKKNNRLFKINLKNNPISPEMETAIRELTQQNTDNIGNARTPEEQQRLGREFEREQLLMAEREDSSLVGLFNAVTMLNEWSDQMNAYRGNDRAGYSANLLQQMLREARQNGLQPQWLRLLEQLPQVSTMLRSGSASIPQIIQWMEQSLEAVPNTASSIHDADELPDESGDRLSQSEEDDLVTDSLDAHSHPLHELTRDDGDTVEQNRRRSLVSSSTAPRMEESSVKLTIDGFTLEYNTRNISLEPISLPHYDSNTPANELRRMEEECRTKNRERQDTVQNELNRIRDQLREAEHQQKIDPIRLKLINCVLSYWEAWNGYTDSKSREVFHSLMRSSQKPLKDFMSDIEDQVIKIKTKCCGFFEFFGEGQYKKDLLKRILDIRLESGIFDGSEAHLAAWQYRTRQEISSELSGLSSVRQRLINSLLYFRYSDVKYEFGGDDTTKFDGLITLVRSTRLEDGYLIKLIESKYLGPKSKWSPLGISILDECKITLMRESSLSQALIFCSPAMLGGLISHMALNFSPTSTVFISAVCSYFGHEKIAHYLFQLQYPEDPQRLLEQLQSENNVNAGPSRK